MKDQMMSSFSGSSHYARASDRCHATMSCHTIQRGRMHQRVTYRQDVLDQLGGRCELGHLVHRHVLGFLYQCVSTAEHTRHSWHEP